MKKSIAGSPMILLAGGLTCSLLLFWPASPLVRAGDGSSVTLGEAYFMIGNLTEAAEHLQAAVDSSTGSERGRAFYLLGRISLLTGDFRQAKEYFERALDENQISSEIRFMALVGIGDAHLASGLYEESIRRYRQAAGEARGKSHAAGVELKMSLAEHYMGREEEALERLRAALADIPLLRHWLDREEQFYQTMAMTGIESPPQRWVRFYVVVGPLDEDEADAMAPGERISARPVTLDGKSYLEYGPFPDPVEAMIFSEGLKQESGAQTEVISR